jgi:hypothetical protein
MNTHTSFQVALSFMSCAGSRKVSESARVGSLLKRVIVRGVYWGPGCKLSFQTMEGILRGEVEEVFSTFTISTSDAAWD